MTSDWQYWHKYSDLVKRNIAKPILCPDCDLTLISRVNDWQDESVWLWCPTCSTMIKPGLDLWQRVRAVVSEHYVF